MTQVGKILVLVIMAFSLVFLGISIPREIPMHGIVIVTPRPGRVERNIDITLERPRERNSPEFLKLRGDILEHLHLAGESQGAAPSRRRVSRSPGRKPKPPTRTAITPPPSAASPGARRSTPRTRTPAVCSSRTR